jgi:hypothetical protein
VQPGFEPLILLLLHGYEVPVTASVVWFPEFMAIDPEVPGSIPGTTRFSEK